MKTHPRPLVLAAILAVATLFLAAAPQVPARAQRRPQPEPLPLVKAPARERAVAPAVAPITFADPDGQELILEEMSARTVVHEMLSLTELELRFRNPQSKRMEGRFSFALPPGAAVSRFAYEINGQLMEGEVVERLRANQVYEQFLHQMRDPALLEQDQGNRFSARIFPIAPNAPVRLVLSYTSLLPSKGGERTYTLALRGMQKIGKFSFRAFTTPLPSGVAAGAMTTSAAEVTSFDQNEWTPDRDIVLTRRSMTTEPTILRAGDFYLAALHPRVAIPPSLPAGGRWLFYVDTSASSAEGAVHRARALETILGELPAGDRVEIVAFDNEPMSLASGRASELASRVGSLLNDRLFIGGTDLDAVLRDIRERARKGERASVVIASDLVATLGQSESHQLQSSIDALPAGVRIDALILGNREEAAVAKALTKGRGRVVRVAFTESLDLLAADAAAELQRPVGGSVEISDGGAEWHHPTRFDDVAPGDEILVLGKVRAGEEPRLGAARTVRLDASTFAPLLEREAHRANLQYLAEREASEPSDSIRRALAAEQVRISVEQRVVIPRTTMLVLETEWDYQRFGLDRRALSAILTIEAGGIGRIDRRSPEWRRVEVPPMPMPPMPPPVAPPPPPIPMSKQSADRGEVAVGATTESITVTAEAPMVVDAVQEIRVSAAAAAPAPGAEEGGVVGGVVGGSVTANQAAQLRVDSSTSTRPSRRRPREKSEGTDWTSVRRPGREEIAEFQRKLRENPRDRELYNALGEALAANGEWREVRRLALDWQPYDPENPQVYELLGLAASELGNRREAARAFASLIEIAPAKPELLQRAGLLLLRAGRGSLAETPLRRALELRPDRANSYRHLALILWSEGRVEEAARVLESATRQQFPGWYGNVQRVIREELGYVYRAWMQKDTGRREEIRARAREFDVDLERRDALRITLAWETDANDVDLHVVDPSGEQCFYNHRETKSGLSLHEDITQGLGPEVIRTEEADRGTYHVGVRYFAAGPMGISRGLVVVMRDGELEVHPFRLTREGGAVRYVTAVRVK
jgi:hypothetical protein